MVNCLSEEFIMSQYLKKYANLSIEQFEKVVPPIIQHYLELNSRKIRVKTIPISERVKKYMHNQSRPVMMF
jgi:hypothetical protein